MADLTLSRRIHNCIALVLPPLQKTYHRLVESSRFADIYPEYLFIQHAIIRASVPLMEDALERALALPGQDPLVVPLTSYLKEHIPEEQGHDGWVLEDLEVLGRYAVEVRGRVPPPRVAAMVGAQYYWIRHYHPVVLLGYISVLEGYPPSPEELERVRVRSNLPAEAFRTWEEHAQLDSGHNQTLDTFIDSLPLSDAQIDAMCRNGMMTARLAAGIFKDLLDDHG